MKRIAYLGILLMLVTGCGNKKNSNFNVKNINISQYCEEGILPYIDQIGYVLFKTANGDVLGSVRSVKVAEDKFFVSDRSQIFIFDKDGFQIGKISALGRGPREYLSALIFDVDPIGKKITISDNGGRKLLIYNFNGEFEREVKLDFGPSIIFWSGNVIVQNNDGCEKHLPEGMKEYNLSFLDSNGTFIKSELIDKTRGEITLIAHKSYCYRENGSILYAPFLDNTIYEVSEDTATPLYQLEYDLPGWKSLTENDKETLSYTLGLGSESPHINYEKNKFITPCGTILESDKYFVTAFGLTHWTKQMVVYDKSSQIGRAFNNSMPERINPQNSSASDCERIILSDIPSAVCGERFYVIPMLSGGLKDRVENPQLKEACDSIFENEFMGILYYTLKK